MDPVAQAQAQQMQSPRRIWRQLLAMLGLARFDISLHRVGISNDRDLLGAISSLLSMKADGRFPPDNDDASQPLGKLSGEALEALAQPWRCQFLKKWYDGIRDASSLSPASQIEPFLENYGLKPFHALLRDRLGLVRASQLHLYVGFMRSVGCAVVAEALEEDESAAKLQNMTLRRLMKTLPKIDLVKELLDGLFALDGTDEDAAAIYKRLEFIHSALGSACLLELPLSESNLMREGFPRLVEAIPDEAVVTAPVPMAGLRAENQSNPMNCAPATPSSIPNASAVAQSAATGPAMVSPLLSPSSRKAEYLGELGSASSSTSFAPVSSATVKNAMDASYTAAAEIRHAIKRIKSSPSPSPSPPPSISPPASQCTPACARSARIRPEVDSLALLSGTSSPSWYDYLLKAGEIIGIDFENDAAPVEIFSSMYTVRIRGRTGQGSSLEKAKNQVAKTLLLLMKQLLVKMRNTPNFSPTMALNELRQMGIIRGLVQYECDRSGPDHMPTFTCVLQIEDTVVSHSTGASKRAAEAEAAREVVDKLRCLLRTVAVFLD